MSRTTRFLPVAPVPWTPPAERPRPGRPVREALRAVDGLLDRHAVDLCRQLGEHDRDGVRLALVEGRLDPEQVDRAVGLVRLLDAIDDQRETDEPGPPDRGER